MQTIKADYMNRLNENVLIQTITKYMGDAQDDWFFKSCDEVKECIESKYDYVFEHEYAVSFDEETDYKCVNIPLFTDIENENPCHIVYKIFGSYDDDDNFEIKSYGASFVFGSDKEGEFRKLISDIPKFKSRFKIDEYDKIQKTDGGYSISGGELMYIVDIILTMVADNSDSLWAALAKK